MSKGITQAAKARLEKKVERKSSDTDQTHMSATLLIAANLLAKDREKLALEKQDKGSFANTDVLNESAGNIFKLLELLKYAYPDTVFPYLPEVEKLQKQIDTDFVLDVTGAKADVLQKLERELQKTKTASTKDDFHGYNQGQSIPNQEKSKLSASAPDLSSQKASASKPPKALPRKNQSSETSSSTVAVSSLPVQMSTSSSSLRSSPPTPPQRKDSHLQLSSPIPSQKDSSLRSSPPTPPQRGSSTLMPPSLPPRLVSEPKQDKESSTRLVEENVLETAVYDEIHTDPQGKYDLRKGMRSPESLQTKSAEKPNTPMQGGTKVDRPVPAPRQATGKLEPKLDEQNYAIPDSHLKQSHTSTDQSKGNEM